MGGGWLCPGRGVGGHEGTLIAYQLLLGDAGAATLAI